MIRNHPLSPPGTAVSMKTAAAEIRTSDGQPPAALNGRTWITIVSGLPRSGTSMMMQMLAAGGIQPLTDGYRAADAANPAGYFELEAVKQTRSNPAWAKDAPGKAVKVIYRLLYDLPLTCQYRVIFMRRNLREVMASQWAMLGLPRDATADYQRLIQIFTREMENVNTWLAAQSQFQVHDVNYGELLADSAAAARGIADFLEMPLDIQAMCAAVNPGLYRQKCR